MRRISRFDSDLQSALGASRDFVPTAARCADRTAGKRFAEVCSDYSDLDYAAAQPGICARYMPLSVLQSAE